MNKRPFLDCDKAFECMFDEDIIITDKTGNKHTLIVSVFSNSTSEPLIDDELDTDIQEVSFVVKNSDNDFIGTIERGCKLERPEARKNYIVQSVKEDESIGVIINARQK